MRDDFGYPDKSVRSMAERGAYPEAVAHKLKTIAGMVHDFICHACGVGFRLSDSRRRALATEMFSRERSQRPSNEGMVYEDGTASTYHRKTGADV